MIGTQLELVKINSGLNWQRFKYANLYHIRVSSILNLTETLLVDIFFRLDKTLILFKRNYINFIYKWKSFFMNWKIVANKSNVFFIIINLLLFVSSIQEIYQTCKRNAHFIIRLNCHNITTTRDWHQRGTPISRIAYRITCISQSLTRDLKSWLLTTTEL